MSREDQVNAELASRVEAGRQSIALKLKQPSSEGFDPLGILTDDEAIIITGRIYDRLDKIRGTSEKISIGLGFVGMVMSIIGQNFGPLIIFGLAGFGYYYFAWTRRKGTIVGEILTALIAEAESKRARLGMGEYSPSSQTVPSSAPTFDVPPQDG